VEIGPSSNPKEGDRECEGPNLARDIESKSESDLDNLEDGEIALSIDLGEHTGEEISVDLVTGVSPVEASVPIFRSSIGDAIVEPDYAAMVVEEPSFVTDLALVRVDLAKDFPSTAHAFESGSSMLLCSNQEDPDSRLSVLERHSQTEVVQCQAEPLSPLVCEPLAVVAPPTVPTAPGKPHTAGSDRSNWVNTQYRGLCELVGFPLDSHEQ
jgi:hypothetical protein